MASKKPPKAKAATKPVRPWKAAGSKRTREPRVAKKREPKKKPGRPSKYTPDLVAKICDRLALGEPMAQICRDEGMPAYRTIKDWIDGNVDVSAAIALAREEGFDRIAAETLEIADDGRNDYVETEKGPAYNAEHVQRSKLRVDTRLKLLAKWDPKRYGEKVQQEISGPDGGPIETRYAKFDDADLDKLILEKAAALGLKL